MAECLTGDRTDETYDFTEGIRVVPIRLDGKKYLVVCYVSVDKSKCWKKIYLVEHLVNEKLEVTDQTLADEERIFKTPKGYPNK